MGEFATLYIDMNSFFASVEQHLDEDLRGKPVAITANEGLNGACVAASYEAKAFGVKTGTTVRDALKLCPGIALRPSRHRLYVRYNLAVADILDRYAELEKIRSVDEFQVILSGPARELEGAAELVRLLKEKVTEGIGPCLRFSAGIGPNPLLAKIAGKLQKPDGFSWLSPRNMPGALAHLELDDLPGISSAMKQRLERAGVRSIPELWALDPRHARVIWNSVEGERFVRGLQGMVIPQSASERGGFGNSKILAPEFRAPRDAYLVSRWLVERAAERLRREGRTAASFNLQIAVLDRQPLSRTVKCAPSQDTSGFLAINRAIWRAAWPQIRGRKLMSIGVQLGNVELLSKRSGDLLRDLAPAEKTRSEKLSAAADFINQRYGAGTVTFGVNAPHPGFFERG